MAARAMPVFPDDGSTITCPGRSRSDFSASSIMYLAMRSLTEPNGFWFSSLARMRTSGLGDSTETSTSGVLPMRSSTLSCTLAIVSTVCSSSPNRDNSDPIRQQSTANDARTSDLAADHPLATFSAARNEVQTTSSGTSLTDPSTMR